MSIRFIPSSSKVNGIILCYFAGFAVCTVILMGEQLTDSRRIYAPDIRWRNSPCIQDFFTFHGLSADIKSANTSVHA